MVTIIDAIEARGGAGTLTVLAADGTTRTATWAAVHDRARRLAEVLNRRGVGRGDRVCLLADTSVELVAAVQATWLAGAAVTMLPLPVRTADAAYRARLERLLADARPALLALGDPCRSLRPALARSFATAELKDLVAEARGWAAGDPSGGTAGGSRDPAVHQRIHPRPARRAGHARAPDGQPGGHPVGDPARGDARLPAELAAALPRHGPGRRAGAADVLRLPARAPVTGRLRRPPDRVARGGDLVPGHRHRRPEFRLGADGAAARRPAAARPGRPAGLAAVGVDRCGAGGPGGDGAFRRGGRATRSRPGGRPVRLRPGGGHAGGHVLAARGGPAHRRRGPGGAGVARPRRRRRRLPRAGRWPGSAGRCRAPGCASWTRPTAACSASAASAGSRSPARPSPPATGARRRPDRTAGCRPGTSATSPTGSWWSAAGNRTCCSRPAATSSRRTSRWSPAPCRRCARARPSPSGCPGRGRATGWWSRSSRRRGRTTSAVAALRAAVVAAVVAEVGLTPREVAVLAPGQLCRTSSGKPRRAETRRRYLAGELAAPERHGPDPGRTGRRLEAIR